MPENDVFRIQIVGSGSINDVSFTAEGDGTGDTKTGRLRFDATFSEVPRDTDAFANLLGVLIIPTNVFGQELGDAVNLMTLAGGEFEFTQEITGEGIYTSSSGKVERSGDDEFTWSSRAEGRVELSSVDAIKPIDAVMIPSGRGTLTEVLTLPIVERGVERPLQAVRQFSYEPRSELSRLQLRRIEIEPRIEDRRVSVDIRSVITTFDKPQPRAAAS